MFDETESDPAKTSIKLFGISCLLALPFVLLMIEVIRDPKAAQGASTIGGCFFCLGTSLNIAGAAYGFAGLLQRQRRHAFWGLVLNIMLPIIIYLFAYLVDRAVMPPNP
jgi:hypothetical protein